LKERPRAVGRAVVVDDDLVGGGAAPEPRRLEDDQRAALAALEARFSGFPQANWKRLIAKATGLERYVRFRKAFRVAKGILHGDKPS